MRIYVGNISYQTTSQQLTDFFAQVGDVQEAFVAVERETGRSRGFGFVEMPDETQARTAIESLNGRELDGRTLVVNEARARTDSRGGGGGGYNNRRSYDNPRRNNNRRDDYYR